MLNLLWRIFYFEGTKEVVLYICGGLHGEWKIVGYLGLWWMVGNMNEKSEMHAIETIEF